MKLFQVEPLVKISMGYVPIVALDHTKTKLCHWCLVHHKVCSIANGCWFACAWVDKKELELTITAEVALSKMPAFSILMPPQACVPWARCKPKVDVVSMVASSSIIQ